jgi:acetolactate synthase-1/2/3 large subunit
MHLVDSLGRNKNIEYVCCHHEQAAAIAAGAYAQYSNTLGVALVTTGPGGTNAITGAAGAWTESLPLLIISGQVKRADLSGTSGLRTKGFQEIDIVSLVRPITKYAVTITDPNDIRHHLEQAVHLAKSGRPGPVWLDIPLDVQAAKIDEDNLQGYIPEPKKNINVDQKRQLEKEVSQVIELFNSSERPVILAGFGIKLCRSEKSFLELADLLQIPVLTAWKAMDLLPENHPLYFGRPGTMGQRGANFVQQNADLLIAIGARLDFGQIGYSHETFARKAKKVIVEIDPAEFKKFAFTVDIPLNVSADEFLEKMLSYQDKIKPRNRTVWLARCREWKTKYPVVLPEYRKKTDNVSTYVLIETIAEEASPDDIFVPGSSGMCSDIFMQAFKVTAGQKIMNTPGFGAMGFGLPSSIGACFASNKKRIICVNGDGGFQLNIQELETVSRFKLPIKFFILNNQAYNSIKTTQRNYFNGFYVASDPSSGVTIPNMMKVAGAYTIPAFRISNQQELKVSIQKILATPGPTLAEVIIDPMEVTMPKASSEILPDGKIVSKPLEDLWPFLSREELRENMII